MNRLFTLIIAFLCSVVAMAQAELSTPFTPDARWEQLKPGLHATWTDTDVLTSKYACPVENSRTLNLSGWRGERIHAKLLVYARSEQEHVNFTVLPSESKNWIDTTTTRLHALCDD